MTQRRFKLGLVGILLAALMGSPLFGQQPEAEQSLKKEVEALKQGQVQIRKQLEEIMQLLRARPAAAAPRPAPAVPSVRGKVFDLGDNPVMGESGAKLTLIEFTDYQCGFCSRHARNTAPQIKKEYVDTGKLRYAALDLPLNFHKLAFKAAEVSHCAGEQGKFWEMHDRLFENQQALEPWNAHAEALGLDLSGFESCLSSGKFADVIRKDMAEARKAGASGTPSFVLGLTDSEDPSKVKGLTFIRGARAYAVFKSAIEKALGESGE